MPVPPRAASCITGETFDMAELYPPSEQQDQGTLEVGDGNLVYWEVRGNRAQIAPEPAR
jgi:hypothetical protein